MLQLACNFKNNSSYAGWVAFEKLDGIRAIWDGHGNLTTRGHKLLTPPPFFVAQLPVGKCIDGELWAGRAKFQDTCKIVRSFSGLGWENVSFNAFDVITDDAIRHQSYSERLARLRDLVGSTPNIKVVEPIGIVEGNDWVDRELRRVCDAGGEGLILRDPTAPHQAGRSASLVKVKMAEDDEAVVVGFTKGRNRELSRVGALIVKDRLGREFKIGAGLDTLARIEPPQLGSIVMYSFSQRTDAGVPRHATFIRTISLT